MNVTIKQLGLVEAAAPCSIIDLILQVKPEELNNYCAAKIDGKVVDLRDVVENDCEIELLDKNSPESLPILRHTTAHIMADGSTATIVTPVSGPDRGVSHLESQTEANNNVVISTLIPLN